MELDKNYIHELWPKARQALKKELRNVWSSLLEIRRAAMPAHGVQFPTWNGNGSNIWRHFFIQFISSKYRNILQKIAFSGLLWLITS
jgi:hypothetical protein